MTDPDVDELERLADEALLPMPDKRRRPWFNRQRRFSEAANPATIKALIAELREARGHLARCVELVPEPGAIDAADAFNGKGEG